MGIPLKILTGYIVFLLVLLSPFIAQVGTVWWDEGLFIGALAVSTALYLGLLVLIHSGLFSFIARQIKYFLRSTAFSIQSNRLRQAKQLFDEGLLTESEYQSRLNEIKSNADR